MRPVTATGRMNKHARAAKLSGKDLEKYQYYATFALTILIAIRHTSARYGSNTLMKNISTAIDNNT